MPKLSLQKIVILGAGPLGLAAAQRLVTSGALLKTCEVTVVADKSPALSQASLYKGLAALLTSETKAAQDRVRQRFLPDVSATQPFRHIRFIQKQIVKIEPTEKRVVLAGKRRLAYDKLVIALEDEPQYLGIPGLQEHVRTVRDAQDVERVYWDMVRLLDATVDGQLRQVVIVGIHDDSVAFARQLVLACTYLKKQHRLVPQALQIMLLDADKQALSRVSNVNRKFLAHEKSLKTAFGIQIAKVSDSVVTVMPTVGKSAQAYHLPAHLLVWFGATQTPRAIRESVLPKDRLGNVQVTPWGNVPGQTDVFVLRPGQTRGLNPDRILTGIVASTGWQPSGLAHLFRSLKLSL